MKHTLLCAIAVMPLLAGCGADISYKMGGNVDQLRADRATCGGAESPSYESCMKAKGWGTVDIKGKDVESEAETETAVAEAVPPAPVPTPTPTAANSAPTTAPVAAAKPAPAFPAKDDPRGLSNVKAGPAKKLPKDPNTRVTVNSWWKPGGSGATDAIAACVATLGDEHKPDYTKHNASVGLITCMKKSGWYAL